MPRNFNFLPDFTRKIAENAFSYHRIWPNLPQKTEVPLLNGVVVSLCAQNFNTDKHNNLICKNAMMFLAHPI